MRAYKKYKSASGVEYNFYVRVDGKEQFVSLNGPGTMIIVTSPKLAIAIENSGHFKSGKIILASVVGNMNIPSPEVKPKVSDNSYPEVKNMGDAVDVLRGEPYFIPETDLLLKKQVLEKAKELGVKFPNYR